MLRIFEQLIAKAVRFADDRRGNVALTFGIATLYCGTKPVHADSRSDSEMERDVTAFSGSYA